MEAPTSSLVAPNGIEGIISTFGDIFNYIREDHTLDPRWQTEMLSRITLPFSIPLSWDKSRFIQCITCHKQLAPVYIEIFRQIQTAGLQNAITSFGGCFSFRPQRTGTKLSTHAWGIAIDLNPESNGQGTAGDMNTDVISIFKAVGFTWGGDWQRRVRDPMHFQFCTGY